TVDLAIHDSNARFAPVPICMRCCDETDPDVCVDAHPADLAVCESDGGLEADGDAYRAIFLREVPTRIVTLGTSAEQPTLDVPCVPEDPVKCDLDSECPSGQICSHKICTKIKSIAEFAAVALLDGTVMLVALKDTPTAPLAPSVVGTTWCLPPTIEGGVMADGEEEMESVELSRLLETCPTVPVGRNRLQCLSDASDGGVVISVGNTGSVTWELRWEGLILDRTPEAGVSGAGAVTTEDLAGTTCSTDGDCAGNAACAEDRGVCVESFFTDLAIDLGDRQIRPRKTTVEDELCGEGASKDVVHHGDILEIVSEPVEQCPVEAKCTGASGLDQRALERRILAVERVGEDRSRLKLDSYLDPACLRGDVSYRIRAGDQFVAVSSRGDAERVSPGEQVGPGGDVGRLRREMFRIRELETRPDLAACERYCEDGRPKPIEGCGAGGPTIIDSALARTEPLRVSIQDNFNVFRSGVALDQNANPSGAAAGRIPGAMVVSDVGAEQPVVFMSYSGSDAVLGFVPFDLGDPFSDPRRYLLMR
ncbi:hypothetical protein ACFL6C_06565, partial [Myxococcota bacterium]